MPAGQLASNSCVLTPSYVMPSNETCLHQKRAWSVSQLYSVYYYKVNIQYITIYNKLKLRDRINFKSLLYSNWIISGQTHFTRIASNSLFHSYLVLITALNQLQNATPIHGYLTFPTLTWMTQQFQVYNP